MLLSFCPSRELAVLARDSEKRKRKGPGRGRASTPTNPRQVQKGNASVRFPSSKTAGRENKIKQEGRWEGRKEMQGGKEINKGLWEIKRK